MLHVEVVADEHLGRREPGPRLEDLQPAHRLALCRVRVDGEVGRSPVKLLRGQDVEGRVVFLEYPSHHCRRIPEHPGGVLVGAGHFHLLSKMVGVLFVEIEVVGGDELDPAWLVVVHRGLLAHRKPLVDPIVLLNVRQGGLSHDHLALVLDRSPEVGVVEFLCKRLVYIDIMARPPFVRPEPLLLRYAVEYGAAVRGLSADGKIPLDEPLDGIDILEPPVYHRDHDVLDILLQVPAHEADLHLLIPRPPVIIGEPIGIRPLREGGTIPSRGECLTGLVAAGGHPFFRRRYMEEILARKGDVSQDPRHLFAPDPEQLPHVLAKFFPRDGREIERVLRDQEISRHPHPAGLSWRRRSCLHPRRRPPLQAFCPQGSCSAGPWVGPPSPRTD